MRAGSGRPAPGPATEEWPDGYPGGCAFGTAEEARLSIEKDGLTGFSVFEMTGDLLRDTWVRPRGERSILRDRLILGEA